MTHYSIIHSIYLPDSNHISCSRSVIVAGNSKSSGLLVVTPVLKIANFH